MYIDFHSHTLIHRETQDIKVVLAHEFGHPAPTQIHTLGRHPWFVERMLNNVELGSFQKELMKENCIGLGEIGLDKLKGPEFELQLHVFEQLLELNRSINKPVILHCVKAFDELMRIKQKFPEIQFWCVHGFNKSPQLALQLINQGFYLSMNPGNKPSERYKKLLKNITLDIFFLETDDHSELSIDEIYLNAAKMLEIDLPELQEQVKSNFNSFFINEQLA